MMTREEAEKELIAMLEEAEGGLFEPIDYLLEGGSIHTPWKKWTLICVSYCIRKTRSI